MKIKAIFFIILSLYFSKKTIGQHCPFDGASIVLIKVMSKTNKTDFMLKEVNNPNADSCTYAEGLLDMKFQPIDSFYTKNHWIETYEKRYKMQKLSTKGDLYIKLNQATADCMIKNGNDYTYIKRHFIIRFKNKKTGEVGQIEVPESKIFKMCTASGSWDRFEAIIISE
jgi:hypothetical protein